MLKVLGFSAPFLQQILLTLRIIHTNFQPYSFYFQPLLPSRHFQGFFSFSLFPPSALFFSCRQSIVRASLPAAGLPWLPLSSSSACASSSTDAVPRREERKWRGAGHCRHHVFKAKKNFFHSRFKRYIYSSKTEQHCCISYRKRQPGFTFVQNKYIKKR